MDRLVRDVFEEETINGGTWIIWIPLGWSWSTATASWCSNTWLCGWSLMRAELRHGCQLGFYGVSRGSQGLLGRWGGSQHLSELHSNSRRSSRSSGRTVWSTLPSTKVKPGIAGGSQLALSPTSQRCLSFSCRDSEVAASQLRFMVGSVKEFWRPNHGLNGIRVWWQRSKSPSRCTWMC